MPRRDEKGICEGGKRARVFRSLGAPNFRFTGEIGCPICAARAGEIEGEISVWSVRGVTERCDREAMRVLCRRRKTVEIMNELLNLGEIWFSVGLRI